MSALVIPTTACGSMSESSPSPAGLAVAPLQAVPELRRAPESEAHSQHADGGQRPPAIYPSPRASAARFTVTIHASEESQS
jgi:hypothetical protein